MTTRVNCVASRTTLQVQWSPLCPLSRSSAILRSAASFFSFGGVLERPSRAREEPPSLTSLFVLGPRRMEKTCLLQGLSPALGNLPGSRRTTFFLILRFCLGRGRLG